MAHVEVRTVKRYFVNGKGYGTSYTAYRKVAQKMLVEYVFGTSNWEDIFEEQLGWGCDRKEAIDAAFAEKFPHSLDDECRDTCAFHYTAGNSYPHVVAGPPWDDALAKTEEPAFKSCKAAQDRWLKEKIAELRQADKLAAKQETP